MDPRYSGFGLPKLEFEDDIRDCPIDFLSKMRYKLIGTLKK